jgi:DHA1 family tetracycline resistance protein-like MFS transporter
MQGGSDNRILIFVAFIVFIDTVGLGLILPVTPALIGEVADVSVDRAAEIGGALHFSFAIMQFFFAPIIAGLSDRFGRRPVLLAALFLLGLDYAIMAWAPSIGWLFFGRVVSGIMGASWAAANSCVADIARPEDRGRMFGLLGGVGALGFVIGPAVGGIWGNMTRDCPLSSLRSWRCWAPLRVYLSSRKRCRRLIGAASQCPAPTRSATSSKWPKRRWYWALS